MRDLYVESLEEQEPQHRSLQEEIAYLKRCLQEREQMRLLAEKIIENYGLRCEAHEEGEGK